MPKRLTKQISYIRLPEKRITEIEELVASWSNETKEFMRARLNQYRAPSGFFGLFTTFYRWLLLPSRKQDLKILKDPLVLLIDYHQLNFPKHQAQVEVGKELIQKINYRMKYVAEEKTETLATFKVGQIHNAIHDDMTFEELRSEFARIIEPTVRDLVEEKEKETKKGKNKKSKEGKKKK